MPKLSLRDKLALNISNKIMELAQSVEFCDNSDMQGQADAIALTLVDEKLALVEALSEMVDAEISLDEESRTFNNKDLQKFKNLVNTAKGEQ